MKHINKNIFQGILGQRPEQDHVKLNMELREKHYS